MSDAPGSQRRWVVMEIVRRILALASFAIVARSLSIEEFANFVVLTTAFSILLALTQGSLDRLLVRLWLEDTAAAVQAAWWSLGITMAATVGIGLIAGLISGWHAGAAGIAYGLGAAFVIGAWTRESRTRAEGALRESSRVKSAMEVGPAVARAGAAVLTGDLLAVMTASLIAALLPGAAALRRLPRPDRGGMRAVRHLVARSGGVGLLSAAYWRIDVFLLSLLTTPAALAGYAIAVRGLEVALVIPSVFGQLTIPEFVRERGGRGAAWAKGMKLVALGVGLAMLGITTAWVAADVMGDVLQKDLDPHVIALLAAVLPPAFLGAILGNELYAAGREAELLKILAAMVIANVAMNVILIPETGPEGAALSTLITETAGVAWLWRRSRTRHRARSGEVAA